MVVIGGCSGSSIGGGGILDSMYDIVNLLLILIQLHGIKKVHVSLFELVAFLARVGTR